MNQKENALKIINFEKPERIVSDIPQYTLSYVGCNHEGFNGKYMHDSPLGTEWKDVWGTGWKKIHKGVMGMCKEYPLCSPKKLRTFKWLDPYDKRICGKIYNMKEKFSNKKEFLNGSHRDTLWEKSYMLVGMENIMTYFYTEPGFVREVLHNIMNFQLGIAEHYIKLGVEIVSLGDDLGTQDSLLLNPKIIKEFLIPEYKRLFNLYKNNNVLINFHSCGKIEEIIEIFMKLGVDILNPIQATANDLDKIREITKGHMALHGGVSSNTIMNGSRENIIKEVIQRIWQLGYSGGYFCSPDQGMPYPKNNLKIFNDAIKKYGIYPLKRP